MHYLLYITDTQFTLYSRFERLDVQVFARSDLQQLEEVIEKWSIDDQLFMVLDLMEEEFEFEWLPKVKPWELASLLKRRVQRFSKDKVALVEARATSVQRKNTQGRREVLIMTAALHSDFSLKRLFEKLETSQIPLKQIYSPPVLLSTLVTQNVSKIGLPQSLPKSAILMTTRQNKRFYRQTFTLQDTLRFSRIFEVEDVMSITSFQDRLLKETRQALSYLQDQKIIESELPIGLVFLEADPSILSGFSEKVAQHFFRSEQQVQQSFVVTSSFKKFFNQHSWLLQEGDYGQQVMLEAVLTDYPKGFYQTIYAQKIQKTFLGRHLIAGMSSMIGLGLFAYWGFSGVNLAVQHSEQQMLDQQIQAYQLQKNQLQPVIELSDKAQTLKSSVEFSKAILDRKAGRVVDFDIQALSQVLAKHSHIQLTTFSWQRQHKLDSQQYQLELSGWVFPFAGTYQQPVQWVDALVAELQKLPKVTGIELTQAPFNRNRNQTVSIDTDRQTPQALEFSFIVNWQGANRE